MVELTKNVLPTDEATLAFSLLRPTGNEVKYGQYYALTEDQSLVRLPRLMAFQASINEANDSPWYRCTMASVPQNKIVYHPWTSTVEKIKMSIEKLTGATWNLAHIIYYKDGEESMGMHSDTMLDLAPGSKISIFSLGSTRQMTFIKKKESTFNGQQEMIIDLPGNSLFLLDEETNKHYVHGIRKQKKNQVQDRVSIVFRHVVTFKTDTDKLYGNGSFYGTKQDILRRDKIKWILKSTLPFVLTILALWQFSFGSSIMQMIVVGIIYWFLVNSAVEHIDRLVTNHIKNLEKERLKRLCQMKNFRSWDQNDMPDFLKYD